MSATERSAAQDAVASALDEAAVAYRVSPVSLEQLGLALGCDPTLDSCLVRIAREVAGGTLMVRRIDAADGTHGPRLTLVAVSADDGRIYRSELALGLAKVPENAPTPLVTRGEERVRARPITPRHVAERAIASEPPAPREPAPPVMSPLARTVGASALSAAAVLTIAGAVEATRARNSAADDDADQHARVARGVLGTAGVLAASGTLALLWHKIHEPSDAPKRSSLELGGTVVRGGALVAWRGQWGGAR